LSKQGLHDLAIVVQRCHNQGRFVIIGFSVTSASLSSRAFTASLLPCRDAIIKAGQKRGQKRGHPLVGPCQAQKTSLARKRRILFRVIIFNDNRDFRLEFSILFYTKIILAILVLLAGG
jgi:hypothetical protein